MSSVYMYRNESKGTETGDEADTGKQMQIVFLNLLCEQKILEENACSVIMNKIMEGEKFNGC